MYFLPWSEQHLACASLRHCSAVDMIKQDYTVTECRTCAVFSTDVYVYPFCHSRTVFKFCLLEFCCACLWCPSTSHWTALHNLEFRHTTFCYSTRETLCYQILLFFQLIFSLLPWCVPWRIIFPQENRSVDGLKKKLADLNQQIGVNCKRRNKSRRYIQKILDTGPNKGEVFDWLELSTNQ